MSRSQHNFIDKRRAFDGYGLRSKMPARPALTPHIRFLFIDSRFCSTLLSDAPHGSRRFANPSPPSGWMEDFHFRAAEHARHTSIVPCGTFAFLVKRSTG
jgi:hypothetical protein